MAEVEREAEAERVRRGATRRMALFAALFLLWQLFYFALLETGPAVRTVDVVRVLAYLAWAAALLALFATGGAMFRNRRLRPFLSDELAVATRAASYRVGFWVMIALCMAAYAATLRFEIRAMDIAHLVLSGGVLAVLVAQLVQERR